LTASVEEDLMRPLPDQVVAIDKLRKVKSRLVGDSMGVGKTVTGIGLDLAMREDDPSVADLPTLIVSEKIGIDVWVYHLRAMGIPEEDIVAIDPADRAEFMAALEHEKNYQAGRTEKPPRGVYYVMHYDIIMKPTMNVLWERRTRTGKKHHIQWAHVIADEVHLIKNRKALKTLALKKINAFYKTGLSGTPADDKPWDIWSILHWLYPRKYRSYWTFYEKHVQWVAASEYDDWLDWEAAGGDYDSFRAEQTRLLLEEEKKQFEKTGKRVKARPSGFRQAIGVQNIPEFHRNIGPFYIRRTLLQINPDMPPKIHVEPPIIVPMTPRQRKEYERMRDKSIALLGGDDDSAFQLLAPATIAVWTRLQQMALATLIPEWDDSYLDAGEDDADEFDMPKIVLAKPSPKLDAVMNLVTTHEDEPFVVFSQFRGMVDLVEEECQRLKISCVKIHGGVTSKDIRTQRVEQFQDGRARVFVGTIGAAGKTITLTRSHHAIFTDRSWNPSKNAQAEDRLWRRMQKNAVRVWQIQSADSIDQVRFEKIRKKAEMIDALLLNKGPGGK